MAASIDFDQLPDHNERIDLIDRLTRGNVALYTFSGDTIRVPFALGRQSRGATRDQPVEFCGQLTDSQVTVTRAALEQLDGPRRSVLLALYCGAGKTVMILWLLCQIGRPALIIVPRRILVTQWQERIAAFCPSLKYEIKTVGKICPEDKPSVLVLDEVHQLFTRGHIGRILALEPTWLIGASATPWRPDELNVFDLFFTRTISAPRPQTGAHVKLYRTGLAPPPSRGDIVWNDVLTWQSSCAARQAQVVQICLENPTPQLILVKRIEGMEQLGAHLAQKTNAVIQMMTDKEQTVLPNVDYLIGTFSKLGTGLDLPRLQTLVLAADIVEYFEQFAGRILRSSQGTPLFIEIVDDFFPFWKHYRERKKYYDAIGARVSVAQPAGKSGPCPL